MATPPPLVRGPQSVPAGKPSLQVSGVGQAARFRAWSREEGAQHRKDSPITLMAWSQAELFFFFNSQNPTISFLRTIGVGDKSRMSHGDNSHKLIFQWLIILIHSADKYIHTSTNDLWRKRMPWSYVIEIL